MQISLQRSPSVGGSVVGGSVVGETVGEWVLLALLTDLAPVGLGVESQTVGEGVPSS